MKIKKNYHFDNKRQIWRIIPTDNGRLIIEEREPEKKKGYFHCLDLESGKKIFKDFQMDEKFWIGIEAVRDDIIFFHKFAKPDMPKHRGILAVDIKSRELIWQNPDLTYLFIYAGKLYAFNEKFEGRTYFAINPFNGEIIEENVEDYALINNLRNEALLEENKREYMFPEIFETDSGHYKAVELIKLLKNKFVVSGKVEYVMKNELLMMSFHIVNSKGTMNNLFKAVDLSTGKYILEEEINKETSLYLTDSFFLKDDFLFLLFGKNRLQVYKIFN